MIAARQIFLGRGGGAKVPYDAEVEYIHIPSGGWFDTGWTGFQTNAVKMTANIRITQFNAAYDTYFGNFGTNTNYAFLLRRNNQASQLTAYFTIRDFINFNYSPGSFTEFSFDHGDFYIDGVARATGRGGFTMDQSVYVGASYANGGVVFATSEFDLKNFVCEDALGKIVRDFIPVRFTNELGQSEGAMYDRANPTVGMNRDGTPRDDGLYLNRGTGAFNYGNDK